MIYKILNLMKYKIFMSYCKKNLLKYKNRKNRQTSPLQSQSRKGLCLGQNNSKSETYIWQKTKQARKPRQTTAGLSLKNYN